MKRYQSIIIRKLIYTLLAGIAIFSIATLRPYFMDSTRFVESTTKEPFPKIRLNAENMKPFLFGFHPLVADLIWIYTTVEMDLMLPTQEEYNQYYMLSHLATDLDPYFSPIVIYSANQFLFGRQGKRGYDEAIADSQEMLLKGWDFYINRTEEWDHYDRFWVIPQLIGFNYYFELNEKEKALPYYEFIANHVPHAPALYRTFAAEIYKKLNRKDENLNVLENVLAKETLMDQLTLNRNNEQLKKNIRKKMINIQGGIIAQEEVDQYIASLQNKTVSILNTWYEQYPYLTFEQFVSLHAEVYQDKLSSDVSMFEVMFETPSL